MSLVLVLMSMSMSRTRMADFRLDIAPRAIREFELQSDDATRREWLAQAEHHQMQAAGLEGYLRTRGKLNGLDLAHFHYAILMDMIMQLDVFRGIGLRGNQAHGGVARVA